MGFVKFNDKGYLVDANGKPTYFCGINYTSSYVCTNFWGDWRPERVKADLKRISELGLKCVRVPVYWSFYEPRLGEYNKDMTDRFEIFLGWLKEYDLYVMPWFLVGVATGFFDVPFRNGRPFFTGEMIDVAENHLKSFCSKFKDSDRILFWDICDEPEFYSKFEGGESLPYNKKIFARWVRTLYSAIKSVDSNHLVTLGFGHISTENFGMDIRDHAKTLDAMVVTCYAYGLAKEGVDTLRNNYFMAYNLKFNDLGKPLYACEAPGFTTVAYSQEVIAGYFRNYMYSSLINGSAGSMPWVYNDFDPEIWHKYPLDESVFEPFFGITDNNGDLKLSGKELVEFARVTKELKVTDYTRGKAQVAIVIPRLYYDSVATTFRKMYVALMHLKGCSIDVDFVWEDEDLSQYKLVMVVGTHGLTTSAWSRMKEFVNNGGILLSIYENIAGLSAYTNELFGFVTETLHRDFGYNKLLFKQSFGKFKAGDEMKLLGSRDEFLKVRPNGCTVIAEYDDGNTAIVENKLGKGSAIMLMSPLYDGLLDVKYNDFLNYELFDIVETAVKKAVISRPVICSSRCVEVGIHYADNGDIAVMLLNHHNQPVKAKVYLSDDFAGRKITGYFEKSELRASKDEKGSFIEVDFEPAGFRHWKLTKQG